MSFSRGLCLLKANGRKHYIVGRKLRLNGRNHYLVGRKSKICGRKPIDSDRKQKNVPPQGRNVNQTIKNTHDSVQLNAIHAWVSSWQHTATCDQWNDDGRGYQSQQLTRHQTPSLLLNDLGQ